MTKCEEQCCGYESRKCSSTSSYAPFLLAIKYRRYVAIMGGLGCGRVGGLGLEPSGGLLRQTDFHKNCDAQSQRVQLVIAFLFINSLICEASPFTANEQKNPRGSISRTVVQKANSGIRMEADCDCERRGGKEDPEPDSLRSQSLSLVTSEAFANINPQLICRRTQRTDHRDRRATEGKIIPQNLYLERVERDGGVRRVS